MNILESLFEYLIETTLTSVGYNMVYYGIIDDDIISLDEYSDNFKLNINTLLSDKDLLSFNVKTVDFGSGYKSKSNFVIDLLFMFELTDNTLSGIKINVESINNNDIYDIYIFNLVPNFISYLQVSFNELRDNISAFKLGKTDNTEVILSIDSNMPVIVEFVQPNKLSIDNMFIGNWFIKYNVDIKDFVVDSIKSYNSKFNNDLMLITDNNDNWTNDIYKVAVREYDINMKNFIKDFNNKYVTKELYDNKYLLKSFVENYIQRNNKSSLADLLVLFDDEGVDLKSISYLL